MSYTAIYARNKCSELCQSKQGFFFVRIARCFDHCKNDKTWGKWLPVIAIERDSKGNIVTKINGKDYFVYTTIERRTVNYLIPKIGGIVNVIPE